MGIQHLVTLRASCCPESLSSPSTFSHSRFRLDIPKQIGGWKQEEEQTYLREGAGCWSSRAESFGLTLD